MLFWFPKDLNILPASPVPNLKEQTLVVPREIDTRIRCSWMLVFGFVFVF